MGALHPANRLAAYITGRLQPTVLDLSTLSTVVSKVASNPKVAGSEPQSVDLPASNTAKTNIFTGTTSSSSVARRYIRAPVRRHIGRLEHYSLCFLKQVIYTAFMFSSVHYT